MNLGVKSTIDQVFEKGEVVFQNMMKIYRSTLTDISEHISKRKKKSIKPKISIEYPSVKIIVSFFTVHLSLAGAELKSLFQFFFCFAQVNQSSKDI
jgi:hypothetical protein